MERHKERQAKRVKIEGRSAKPERTLSHPAMNMTWDTASKARRCEADVSAVDTLNNGLMKSGL